MRQSSNIFNRLYLFLTSVWMASVFFEIPYMNSLIEGALMAFMIGLVVLFRPGCFHQKPFLYICLFAIVVVFYSLLNKGFPLTGTVYNMLFFICSIATCCSLRFFTQKQLNLVFWVMVGLLSLSLVATFFVLLDNPLAVRTYGYGLSSFMDESLYTEYRNRGMYSYGVGEALAIVTPTFLAYALTTKKKINSYIAYFLVLGSILTQVIAALATSALLTLLFSALTVRTYLKEYGNGKKWVDTTFTVVALLIISAFVFSNTLSEGAMMMRKMEQVNQVFETGEASGDVASRSDMYKQSISVFLHNPLLGLGDLPRSFGSYDENSVSLHTALFDYLGMYGLFVLLLYAGWKKMSRQLLGFLESRQRKVFKWCFFSLFALLLLKGPVTIAVTFCFSTVFCGLFFYNIHNENEMENRRKAVLQ